LVSALGGLDGLIFTAGIGEQSPGIRSAICARLAWLGVSLDETANATNSNVISAAGSAICVCVFATDEEAMIADHTRAIIRANARPMAAAHG
jgi:acetate kinase